MQLFTRGSVAPAGEEATAAFDDRPAAASPPAARSGDECAVSLRRAIEAEIIPRLMLAHGASGNDDAGPAAVAPACGADEPAELADMLLHRAPGDARAYVQARRHAGRSVEAIYLELLAPAARHLGAMWEADLCDFTQVTVGLWRLQQIVHEHGASFQSEHPARATGRRALLVPAPGSQHTFGLLLVGEFFRRGGWQVAGDPTIGLEAAVSLLACQPFDLVGLSVGSECHVDAAASAILALRRTSLNRSLIVMVGGPVVGLWSDFAERVGADATACDGAAAVALADDLVRRRAAPD